MNKRSSRLAAASVLCILATTSSMADEAQLQLGKNVFIERAQPQCALCHTLADAEAVGEVGPILDELAPEEDVVRAAVLNGINAMPSYAELLTKREIDAVAAYVAAVAGGGK